MRARSDREAPIEQRLDRLEHLLSDLVNAVDLNAKRLNAVQAQLDHLSAKIRNV